MACSRLGILLFPLILSAQGSFSDFQKDQAQSFKQEKIKFIDFKKQEDRAFNSHLQKEKKAISEYKKKLRALWPDNDLEKPKKLVQYSKNLHTKSLIDFEHNEVIISQISPAKKISKKELLAQLRITLAMNHQKAFKQNTLEQDIDKISQGSKYVQSDFLDRKPLLSPPKEKMKIKDITLTKKGDVYQLVYKLPKNSTYKRSLNYLVAAKSNARRFNLQAQWLLAIMHSESSFNPLARSHIPAYGLMQIVPKSAGIDSYRFLYKKRRLLSASYLYNTKNNIEMGSAYFHILYYKYLSSIKKPLSRLYCAMAAYNTGAGNVAWAFTRSNSVKKASKIINTMTPAQVYTHLRKNLRYDEPKHYLKNVRERSLSYQKLYNL